jgi:hypothetical protein
MMLEFVPLNLLVDVNPLKFEFVTQLTFDTKRNLDKIWSQWDYFYKFLNDFPEYGDNFNPEFDIKEEYIIDSYSKVYQQLTTKNKMSDLRINPQFDLYYMSYEESLFDKWEKEGVLIGEYDSDGILNTGCCVLLKRVTLNASSFINVYFAALN